MTLAWLALAALAVGCGGRNSTTPSVELEVHKPPSGGVMVLIPAGTFVMGQAGSRPEEAAHEVTVSSFYLDRCPVTQELFEKIMGVNPSKRKTPGNPVERTQWTDAVRFCNKCSELDGLTPCYDPKTWECNFEADGYRLPTEAEWEYACRAGSAARYCCGDSEADLTRYAWFKPHSEGKTRPVGQKLPNAWGLYDMHGNVWQWCHDYFSETYYAESPRENPRGPAQGKMRVLRGGAWDCPAEKCRAAYRFKEYPIFSDACFGADSYGFRRARNTTASNKGTAIVSAPPASSPSPPTQKTTVATTPTAAPGPSTQKTPVATVPATPPGPAARKLDKSRLKGTIIFVSDRSGTLKIWKMHASGRDQKQITQDTHPDADPRFSPDGKRILYTSLRGGFPELWMMNRDGSAGKYVTKGCQGCWAPDGKALLFIRDNQAYIRDLDTGRERRVTPDNWDRCGVPAWSPDGKRIAVASRHLGNIGIFLLNPDGKDSSQLAAQEPCCTPQWSRDGKKILCQTVQGHIYQVGVDGKDWEQMTFGADVQHDGRYSPDGSLILFCRAPTPEGPWQICVKDPNGDEDEYLALTREGSNSLPDWHRDE
jgi:formylglycine-generating enzyme required for sulfatase activity